MRRYAIIVAGGKGLRMGGDVPKQFALLGGRPVLMHTIDAFVKAVPGIRVILVLPEAQHGFWHSLCERHAFAEPHTIACGGTTRFHSVSNGLMHVPDESDVLVAVHDGVRPFVNAHTIQHCFAQAEVHGAVVPVVPVVETVRQLRAGGSCTVDRDAYRLVQTPQTFQAPMLKKAYAQPYVPQFTDDASVVEAMGVEVTLVQGSRDNIKLTTPEDMQLAEALLQCSASSCKQKEE